MVRLVSAASLVLFLFSGLPAAVANSNQAADAACRQYGLVTAPITRGEPLPENEVVIHDGDGVEFARIPVVQPERVVPSTLPATSVIEYQGQTIGTLDLASTKINEINFDGAEPGNVVVDPVLARESEGRRWVIMGSPTGLPVYLVDLQSATATPISFITGEQLPVHFAAVSRDDQYLLVSQGIEVFLIELDSPITANLLDPEHETIGGEFTPNGTGVVYARGEFGDSMELVYLNLETGERVELASDQQDIGLLGVENESALAIAHEEVMRVPLDGSVPEDPIPLDQVGWPLIPNLDLTALLVGSGPEGSSAPYLINLADGSRTEFSALDGIVQYAGSKSARWILNPPTPYNQSGQPGSIYQLLDLNTGTVTPVLTQDSDDVYLLPRQEGPDGRYFVVESLAPAQGRAWLIDALEGTTTQVGSSTGSAIASVSPDGCYLAVTDSFAVGQGRTGTVRLVDLQTMTDITAIPDSLLIGWANILK